MSPNKCFIKNYMEDIVWNFLPGILKKHPDVCHCECCQHDIAAMALNQLPPAYVARPIGEVYTRINTLEAQYRTDVYTALTKAIMVVSKNIRHDPGKSEFYQQKNEKKTGLHLIKK